MGQKTVMSFEIISAARKTPEHIADDRRGLAGIDPSRRRGRADLDAFRAAGTAVKDVVYPCVDCCDECVSVIAHSFPFSQAGELAAVGTSQLLS